MAFLPTIEDGQATGKLQEVYEEIKRARKLKRVSPVLTAFSMRPEVLEAAFGLTDKVTFGGSSLGRRWEEMLATSVSTWNDCHYWLVSHGEFLRAVTRDHALVAALQQDDWSLAELDEKDRALLNFARNLNDTPSEISAADIEALRAAGFTDRNIFDTVVIVAYFNFMNRIADGFGVVPEAEKQESHERHLREVLAAHNSAMVTDRP